MTRTSDYLAEQAMEAGFDPRDPEREAQHRQDMAAQIAAWQPQQPTVDTTSTFDTLDADGFVVASFYSLAGAQQDVSDGLGTHVVHQCIDGGSPISQSDESCPTCGAC